MLNCFDVKSHHLLLRQHDFVDILQMAKAKIHAFFGILTIDSNL